jgi:uncharacterized protein (UPF0333 family)
MEKRLIKIAIFAIVVLGFVACKSTQKITKATESTGNPTADFISAVQNVQPHFKTANYTDALVNLTLNGNAMSIPMSIKIKTDSTIFVSVKPFMGIEAYKAELEPTSVKIFDKINQRYFVTSYSYLSQQFGVDINFYNLQSLLSNQLFCVGRADVYADSCSISKNAIGPKYIDFSNGLLHQKTTIGEKLNVIQTQITDLSKNQNASFEYTQFSNNSGRYFPKELKISSSIVSKVSNISLTFEKVEFDTPTRFNSSDSHRYTRGSIDELLKTK